jgi:7-keto-8-aminopelargonate synthetase-like enzyme
MTVEDKTLPSVLGPRAYRNTETLLERSDPTWLAAAEAGLISVHVDAKSNNQLIVRETGHEFISMCSSAYLGLNFHPKVIQGAITSMEETKTTSLMVSNARIRHNLLAQLETELGDLFGADILTGVSCSVLSFGILPLLASGYLTDDGGPRVMVFDRFCHFSMAYVKPICADESLVLTCEHNDLNYIEDMCRKYGRVAYVADGAYSMGGAAALEGLRELQDKYGLFLYIDDAHSLSIVGEHGEGYARSRLEMNPLTIVVSTLNKAFGTAGGVAMLGRPEWFGFLQRHAGPVGWSQNMEIPIVGASLASAAIHRTPELGELQRTLQSNIDYFDELMPTKFAGNGLPIRVVEVGEASRAVELSAELYRRGYYSSAVFFPIVPQGRAGLRVMIRADISREQIADFVKHVKDLTETS